MSVTASCDQGHSLCRVGRLGLLANRRMKPMYEQTHQRIAWRKLICVVAALLVVAVPMLGSLCAPSDCSSQNAKTAGPCSGMDMPKDATPAIAQSPVACCQLTQIPPAAVRQRTDTQECKAELSSGVSGTMFAGLVATQRMAPRPADSPPPHDVQSLFCTLLI